MDKMFSPERFRNTGVRINAFPLKKIYVANRTEKQETPFLFPNVLQWRHKSFIDMNGHISGEASEGLLRGGAFPKI